MSLIQNTQLGAGGAGFQGTGEGSAAAIIKELQGLNVSLLAGALANTKINLAAIRSEDTIVGALNNASGTVTDIASTISIEDLRATGTITVGTAAAGDTFSVAGLTYTLVLANAVVQPQELNKVKLGADANGTAANIAAAINARESARTQQVSAVAATNVVTVTAVAEGTGGNSIALAETGSSVTISGATLSGGSATGGIKSSGATDQVILFWFNKQ